MTKTFKDSEIWFIVGSQHLYGEETLKQVAEHAGEIAKAFNQSMQIPANVVLKPTVKTTEEIFQTFIDANQSQNCIGVICWMHTFSPAKMWVRALHILQKPILHLHTQFNRDIPWSSIDMDFMNLNQSAHGDREFGHAFAKLRKNRKVVVGFWGEEDVQKQIGDWVRVAAGWADWQGAKIARFGDNMRFVAVTDGDKVSAELQLGFSVNTYAVGDLVKVVNAISDSEVEKLMQEYEDTYRLVASLQKGGAQRSSLYEAAKIELGLKAFLEDGNFKGFTDTFEDLHGLAQLPGIAVQRLMAAGYGFAGEGDWKTAALVRAMKTMGKGLKGGNAFMEDYTYHFDPKNPLVMGSHMLEVDPCISSEKASCEVHPLGIGGKADPVRLVFNGDPGNALVASFVDLGNRFRLIINEVDGVEAKNDLPKLPVARILWKPKPNLETAAAAWILAGGAHHTCYSQNISTQQLEDFAEIANMESVVIDGDTSLRQFKNELRWNETCFK